MGMGMSYELSAGAIRSLIAEAEKCEAWTVAITLSKIIKDDGVNQGLPNKYASKMVKHMGLVDSL